MRVRRRLLLAAFVLGLAVWATAASTARGADVTPVCNGQPCATTPGSWYAGPVTLVWVVSPAGWSAEYGCGTHSYPTDIAAATSSCEAVWSGNPGTDIKASYTISVEVSNPIVSVVPSRPPDSNGWYGHPVAAAVNGSSFSGIASCASTTYAGPDTSNATVSGSCTDNAGKTVFATSAPFPYDATPPVLEVAVDSGDGIVVLHWSIADVDALASLEIVRVPGRHHREASVVDSGGGAAYRDGSVRDGVRYRYTLIATDQAGNVTTESLAVTPGPRLLAPDGGALVSAPPSLRWTPVRRASYYNVQLYRGDRKILSTWPASAKLQLRRRWRFVGRRYWLTPGRYRWYVWPGLGARAAARYGPRVGSRAFVVTRLP